MANCLRHNRPGNIRQSVNFALDDSTYKPSDISSGVREAVTYVKETTEKDMLGLYKKAWNPSTSVPGERFPDPSMKRELAKGVSIRAEIDPRAEVIPKRDPLYAVWSDHMHLDESALTGLDTVNMAANTTTSRFRVPVHPDLVEAKPWNNSTFIEKKEWKKLDQKTLKTSLAKNATKNAVLTKSRVSLRQQQTIRSQRQREEKAQRLNPDQEPGVIVSDEIDWDDLAKTGQAFEHEQIVVSNKSDKKSRFERGPDAQTVASLPIVVRPSRHPSSP